MPVLPGQAGGGFQVFSSLSQGAREAGAEERKRYESDRTFYEQQRTLDLQTQKEIAQMLQQAKQFNLSLEQQRELTEYEAKFRAILQAQQHGFQAGETEKERAAREVIEARQAANVAYANRTDRAQLDVIAAQQRQIASDTENVVRYLDSSPLLTMDRGMVQVRIDNQTFWVKESEAPEGAPILARRENPEFTEHMRAFEDYLGAGQKDPLLYGQTPEAKALRRKTALDFVDNYDQVKAGVGTRRRQIMAEEAYYTGIARRMAGGGSGGGTGNFGLENELYKPGSLDKLRTAQLVNPNTPLQSVAVQRTVLSGPDDEEGKVLQFMLPSSTEMSRFARDNPQALPYLSDLGVILGDVDEGIRNSLQPRRDANGNEVRDANGVLEYELQYSQQFLEGSERAAYNVISRAEQDRKLTAMQAESLRGYVDQTFKWHTATLEFPEGATSAAGEPARQGSGTVNPREPWQGAYRAPDREAEQEAADTEAMIDAITREGLTLEELMSGSRTPIGIEEGGTIEEIPPTADWIVE